MPGSDHASLNIRPYEEHDRDAVVALWRAADLVRPWNDPASDIALCCKSENAALYIGVAGGDPVATIMVGHDGHRGWIYYLAVDSGHEQKGLGRQMVLHAEDWLAARGLPKVQLMVRAGNTEVIGFYDRLGYDEVPRVVMERWLIDAPGKIRRPR